MCACVCILALIKKFKWDFGREPKIEHSIDTYTYLEKWITESAKF